MAETPQVNVRLSQDAKRLIKAIIGYEQERDATGRAWSRTSVIEMAVREAAAARGIRLGKK